MQPTTPQLLPPLQKLARSGPVDGMFHAENISFQLEDELFYEEGGRRCERLLEEEVMSWRGHGLRQPLSQGF